VCVCSFVPSQILTTPLTRSWHIWRQGQNDSYANELLGSIDLKFCTYLFIVLFCWNYLNDIVVGAMTTLTRTPTNKVALQEDLVTLECSTDTTPNDIKWSYGGASITVGSCKPKSVSAGFSTSNNSVAGDCYLHVQGTSTKRRSGPYSCHDGGSDKDAQAVVIVVGQ